MRLGQNVFSSEALRTAHAIAVEGDGCLSKDPELALSTPACEPPDAHLQATVILMRHFEDMKLLRNFVTDL